MSKADEELETLYMDIYDNGFINNDYKEKFKHYVNTRTRQLEQQIEKLKTDIEKLKDGALRDGEWAIYEVLGVLYNHNFEITKGVSN